MQYAMGGEYVGNWIKDQIQGQGTMTHGNGAIFDGNWVKGRKVFHDRNMSLREEEQKSDFLHSLVNR